MSEVKKSMDITESVKTCLNKYVTFTGRARRSEYWYFALAYGVVAALLQLIGLDVIAGIFGLALFLPALAASIRRLHDINKSGWNVLWSLIPVLGSLYVLYLQIQDSDKGANKYGPSPKY